jgi:hypothetical protein
MSWEKASVLGSAVSQREDGGLMMDQKIKHRTFNTEHPTSNVNGKPLKTYVSSYDENKHKENVKTMQPFNRVTLQSET